MRLISTLSLLLLSTVCFSQIYEMIRKANMNNGYSPSKENKLELCNMKGVLDKPFNLYEFQQSVKKEHTAKPRLFLGCGMSRSSAEQPLIIVDGIPLLEGSLLSDINSNDIENIYILKDPEATAIYGSSAGIIIITTKKAAIKTFTIKDFLDDNPIPRATVSFISSDKKDTVMMMANDSGVIMTDKLKGSEAYQMLVSAVGYMPFEKVIKRGLLAKNETIQLSRQINSCEEVIVSAIGRTYRCRLYCCVYGIRIKNQSDSNYLNTKISYKLFPNPVQKGSTITIETTTKEEGSVHFKIFSFDSKLLSTQQQKAIKGTNRFVLNTDPRWTAGIYMVQIYANGKPAASEKIVIQ